ncbi:hypothetical protein IMSAGC019_02250 [Lachnospiraceae bacterium]|nr:hypothetical protein IMSAGC019_02250 [Lachnospiraceae bacterium]
MDLIDKTVEKGTDKTGIPGIDCQTWNMFDSVRTGRKLVLFGIGACAEFFFFHYGIREHIDAVIDNKKAGMVLGNCIGYTYGTENSHLLIQKENALDQFDAEDAVVLVCSTNHCAEILNKVYSYGINNVFILHIMELNERKKNGIYDVAPMTNEEKEKFYSEEAKKIPIQKKKIIFYAFGSYSDHGKYISEILWNQRPDLDIVWILKENHLKDEVPQYVRVILDSQKYQYIYEMSTAHIWVFNLEVPTFIEKRQGQVYFQQDKLINCYYN